MAKWFERRAQSTVFAQAGAGKVCRWPYPEPSPRATRRLESDYMPTSVRSHTKINLGLAIGPLRPDGFHQLTTVYQTLALHELVTVEARIAVATRITLSSSHPRVPTDAGNTAWRIVERCLAMLNLRAEVHIHIDKQLPMQGGLGAGSANAAAALIGLEHQLGRRFSPQERLRVAAETGSDVPLFLLGGAVVGVGRGEEVYPLPDIPSLPCVIALPAAGVSTPQAYRDWDNQHAASALTTIDPSATIKELSRSIAAAFGEPHSSGVFSQREDRAEDPLLALVRTGIENDFEQVVFPQHPSLGEIKRILASGSSTEDPAVYAGLSGSGSALFGLYRTPRAAGAALERLEQHGVTGLITRTLPRSDYWRTMMMADGLSA
jgi:4-diphosphocytidyl-2-C-methyl-D-erythritol kinase